MEKGLVLPYLSKNDFQEFERQIDKLGIFWIGNDSLKRIELIYNLHKNELTNKDICKY